MRVDEYGALVSEIWVDDQISFPKSWAGNRGDSMANTSRFILIDHTISASLLEIFITKYGYVRHPDSAMPWKENDTSSDQCLPFYLAGNYYQKNQMKTRIKSANWKTGNGDFVSPLFAAILLESQWKIDLCLLAQMALFKVPFRWNDEKKWFESMKGSCSDYLNFFHCLPLASPWIRKLVNKETVKAKIHSYFEREPNGEWIIDLYDRAIGVILK